MAQAEYSADGTMKWERIEPPLYWKAADAFVVADRHLPDGTRQHMVKGHVELGLVVSNAQVIGDLDAPEAEFSSQLSHLSDGLRQKANADESEKLAQIVSTAT